MTAGASEVLLHRKQLGAQIAAVLRRDILFGRLQTGTKLSQQELCNRFGTSRMPVRDALRELSYSGLLTRDDGGHAVVAPLKRADVLDSFTIEGMLSGLAARKATELATEDKLKALEELDAAMRAALEEGDSASLPTLNWQFHRTINLMADSPKLRAIIRLVSLEVPRDFLAEVPEWAARSNDEHRQIVAAMRAGDGAMAESLMIEHFSASGAGLTALLESRGVRLG